MIKSSCVECGAVSLDGVMTHAKTCTGNIKPSIFYASRPPAIRIEFDSSEEQAEWLKNLTGSNANTEPTRKLVKPQPSERSKDV